MNTAKSSDTLLTLTSQIVSAHLTKNSVGLNDVSELIQRVYATLQGLGGHGASAVATKAPAVPVKKSVTNEYIICLEDGSKHKMMKRYLKTAFDMTPDEYRKKWGLASDYPMVSPAYAKTRSALAKKSGLGLRPKGRGRR
jgi:predicted transcriptional regulator